MKTNHILIAPNAFKGSLSADQVAENIAEGLEQSALKCDLTLLPVADGGDGTARLLTLLNEAKIVKTEALDPLGRERQAILGWNEGNREAYIDVSEVSGLKLLKPEERNPLKTHSFGLGQLMIKALDLGAKKILIGVGGSATVDGGMGMLHALGLRFFDKKNKELQPIPEELVHLDHIDPQELDKRILDVQIHVLCDVTNKLLGRKGAAQVFGPQKGAEEKDVQRLETVLTQWNWITYETMGEEMSHLTYGGAAGGIAAALSVYTHAKLSGGIHYFLKEVDFSYYLADADFVITGEGRIDEQTPGGKAPWGVALRAKEKNVKVIGLAGQVEVRPRSKLYTAFDQIIAINPPRMPLSEAMGNTAAHLKKAAKKWGDSLAATQKEEKSLG